MRKNKHVRPIGDSRLEIDLPDGKTIIVEPTRINYGHNDFATILTWKEKKDA